jgi:hypothetical protein
MLFARLKRIPKSGRLRLRGPCGARDEFLLAGTGPTSHDSSKTGIPPSKSTEWAGQGA